MGPGLWHWRGWILRVHEGDVNIHMSGNLWKTAQDHACYAGGRRLGPDCASRAPGTSRKPRNKKKKKAVL